MKKFWESIFDKEEINTGRQFEVDLAKAVLIFFLALVHVTIISVHDADLCYMGIPYFMDSIVGGPYGAPCFMLAMGVGLAYARKKDGKTTMYRGCTILVLAFILNMLRCGIPYFITYLITGDYDFYIKNLWTQIFALDILAFAGPALILMGIMQLLKLKDWQILIAGFVMSLVGNLFSGIDFGNDAINVIAGFFIGTESSKVIIYTDFPLLNWFIFPAAGLCFGNLLKKMKNKGKFYLTFAPICNVIAIVAIVLEYELYLGMFSEGDNCFYHMTTIDAVLCCIANLGMLGIYYWLERFFSEKAKSVVNAISRNINRVYFLQWIFARIVVDCIVRNVYGSVYTPMYAYLTIGVLVSLASIILAILQEKHIKAKMAKKEKKIESN